MTIDTRAAALTQARQFRDQFGLRGWKIRVWKNMGWHWDLHKDHLWVYAHESRKSAYKWSAGISTHVGGRGTLSLWADPNSYSTPQAAINAQLAECDRVLTRLTEVVNVAKSEAYAKGTYETWKKY